jgi:hypothetical protein
MKISKIYAVDFVLIVGSLILLMILVGYSRPMILSPLDDLRTTDSVLFSIESAEEILIDDNIDFTSPERYVLEDDLEISLEPGKYYWKAKGLLSSEIRSLEIKSLVELKLVGKEGNYSVVNVGNTLLNVDIYNGTSLVDSVSVGIGGEVSGGNKFIGGSDE